MNIYRVGTNIIYSYTTRTTLQNNCAFGFFFFCLNAVASNHLCVLRNCFHGILVIKEKHINSSFSFPVTKKKKIKRFDDQFFFSSDYVTTHNGDTTLRYMCIVDGCSRRERSGRKIHFFYLLFYIIIKAIYV